ncbi:MAG: protein kinase [Planctomycetes bacterium]|nr:protein kinase [Planctomycetota bacterium]
MPIQVTCANTQCRQVLSCPDESAGQQVNCPKCGTTSAVPARRAAAPPPTTNRLGQYVLTRKLGEGGMGVVYEGIQDSLNRRVAIKVLHQRVLSNPAFVERFQREARAAAALNHPNIITVYDIGQDRGLHYFSMEYVEGESLQKKLRRQGKLDVPEALSIASKVSDALNYAWNRWSIIHRDIKPDNIMVTSDGQVKLADLGLAKSTREETSVTMTGTGIGTPAYMAPEQGRGAKDVDCRADVYSLGITLFHLITGETPFKGDTALAMMMAHTEQALPSPKKLNPALPDNVCHLVERMCAKDPAQRYPTHAELLADLEKVQAGQPIRRAASVAAAGPAQAGPGVARDVAAAGERRTRQPREKPKKSGVFAAAVVILSLGLIGGGAYYIKFGQSSGGNENSAKNPSGTVVMAKSDPGGSPNAVPGDRPATSTGVAATGAKASGGAIAPPPGERVSETAAAEAAKAYREAEKFAEENPKAFQAIVERFRSVRDSSRNTDYEARSRDQIEKWQAKRDAEALSTFQKLKNTVDQLADGGKRAEALDLWEKFPQDLLTSTVANMISEEREKLSRSASPASSTSSRVPEQTPDVPSAQYLDAQVEAFGVMEAALNPLLKNHQYSEIESALEKQAGEPNNGLFQEALEGVKEDVKAVQDFWPVFLKKVEESAGGPEESFGARRGKVVGVRDGKILLEEKGGPIGIDPSEARALQIHEKLKLSMTDSEAAHRYALGVLFLHEGRKDKAKDYFDSLGSDYPGVARQRQWMDLSREAEARKAIRDAMEARVAKNYAQVTKLVPDILQKFSDTQTVSRQKSDLEKLKEEAAGALEAKMGRSEASLDKLESLVKRASKEIEDWRDNMEEKLKRAYAEDMTDSQVYRRYESGYEYYMWDERGDKAENLKVLKQCLESMPSVTKFYDVSWLHNKKLSAKKEIERLEKEIAEAKKKLETGASKLKSLYNKKKSDLKTREGRLQRRIKGGEDLSEEDMLKELRLEDSKD